MNETEADVIGLDWRVPFDEGWKLLNHRPAVQGNLDPVCSLPSGSELKQRAKTILDLAGNRPGHIFNLGHGILPQTPVENVKKLAKFVQEYSAQHRGAAAEVQIAMQKPAVLLLAHGTPDRIEEIPAYLANVTSGRPLPPCLVIAEIQHRYSLIGRSPLTEITLQQAARISAGAGAAHLRRHAQLEAVHPRHGSADDSRRRHPRRCHLPCAAQLAHQRRPLSPRRDAAGKHRRMERVPFTVDFVPEWHAEPLLIRAFSEKLRDGWSRACLDANAPGAGSLHRA